MEMLAGALKAAPGPGLVIDTVGMALGPFTVTVTAIEVAVSPSLSVATAVRL